MKIKLKEPRADISFILVIVPYNKAIQNQFQLVSEHEDTLDLNCTLLFSLKSKHTHLPLSYNKEMSMKQIIYEQVCDPNTPVKNLNFPEHTTYLGCTKLTQVFHQDFED